MKICSKCLKNKPRSEFGLRPDRKSGIRSHCKICERGGAREYRKNFPVESRQSVCRWKKLNPDKVREHHRRKNARRFKFDLLWRIHNGLRSRIRMALNIDAGSKAYRTVELVGCSVVYVQTWLELQFQDGMDWENHGEVWHIDHIRPCASFDLTDPKQQKQCFHYTNLQPLWAKANLVKSDQWVK